MDRESIRKLKVKSKDIFQAFSALNETEKAVVKATNRRNRLPKEKHIRTILIKSRGGDVVNLCRALFRRYHEKEFQTVLKALYVTHRTLRDGSKYFVDECFAGKHHLLLNSYVDKTNAESRDQTLFIRVYAQYLEEWITTYRQCAIRPPERDGYEDPEKMRKKESEEMRNISIKDLLHEIPPLMKQLRAAIHCEPTGGALRHVVSLSAFTLVLRDTFRLYRLLNEGIIRILDAYFDMERSDAKEALKIYREFVTETEGLIKYYQVARNSGAIESRAIPDVKPCPPDFIDSLELYIDTLKKGKKMENKPKLSLPRAGTPPRSRSGSPRRKSREEEETNGTSSSDSESSGSDSDTERSSRRKKKGKDKKKDKKKEEAKKEEPKPDLLGMDAPSTPSGAAAAAAAAGSDFFSSPSAASTDFFAHPAAAAAFASAPGQHSNPFAAAPEPSSSSNPFSTTPPMFPSSPAISPRPPLASNPFAAPPASNGPMALQPSALGSMAPGGLPLAPQNGPFSSPSPAHASTPSPRQAASFFSASSAPAMHTQPSDPFAAAFGGPSQPQASTSMFAASPTQQQPQAMGSMGLFGQQPQAMAMGGMGMQQHGGMGMQQQAMHSMQGMQQQMSMGAGSMGMGLQHQPMSMGMQPGVGMSMGGGMGMASAGGGSLDLSSLYASARPMQPMPAAQPLQPLQPQPPQPPHADGMQPQQAPGSGSGKTEAASLFTAKNGNMDDLVSTLMSTTFTGKKS